MGYKNDQFAGLGSSESGYAYGTEAARVKGRKVTTNAPFGGLKNFPDNRVRTTYRDANGELKFDYTVLKKGYIRSLLTTTGNASSTEIASVPVLRCDFQFNPDRLVQSVPMRTSLVNVFQQDPAQLVQPLAGDVSFGFNLVFDRTYTYNNSDDTQVDPDLQGSYGEQNIGVLHDLRILYSIIGQGISKDFVDAAVGSAISQARNVASAEEMGDSNEERQQFVLSDEFGTAAGSFFNANIGNSAFLIPTPVRVVFSGLYVVDGYITSSTTTFVKFSSSYVPLQCNVGLTMQALYIGFANPRSFVVSSLEDARKDLEAQVAANVQLRQDTADAFINSVPKLEVNFKVEGATTGVWRQLGTGPGRNLYADDQSIGYYLFEPDVPDGTNFSRYAKIKAIPRTTTTGRRNDRTVDADDEIRALFANNEASPPTVTVNIEAFFYGPTTTTPEEFIASYTEESAEDLLISTAYTNLKITSLEDYDALKSGKDVTWIYQQRNNSFTRAYLKTLLDDNPDYLFYIRVNSSISASIGGSTPVSKQYQYVWVKPSSGVKQLDSSLSVQTSRS